MAPSTDKVTRFDAELVDSAIAEGGRQNRTGRQQLEYWARIGRAMTAHESASLRRVHDALSGSRPVSDLTDARGVCSTRRPTLGSPIIWRISTMSVCLPGAVSRRLCSMTRAVWSSGIRMERRACSTTHEASGSGGRPERCR